MERVEGQEDKIRERVLSLSHGNHSIRVDKMKIQVNEEVNKYTRKILLTVWLHSIRIR